MTKRLLLIPLILLIGCKSFSTNTFRAEQAATDLVFAAYVGYTNALPHLNITQEQKDKVADFRLRFAATVKTSEALRASYQTNSSVKPQIQALLTSLTDQSSNIVWLVNYLQGKP